jgi:hypothetical protein
MPQLGFRHISSPDQLLLQDLSDAALRIAAKVAKLPELFQKSRATTWFKPRGLSCRVLSHRDFV